MKKEMLINVLQPEECRIAIVEDGVLEELYVERTSHESYTGNIYKGKIVNIEPAIQAAFVDFSVGRNGFLHVSDVEPQYYQRTGADEETERAPRDRDREPRKERAQAPERDRDRDRERAQAPERDRDRDRERAQAPERDRDRDRERAQAPERDRERAQASERDRDRERGRERPAEREPQQPPRRSFGDSLFDPPPPSSPRGEDRYRDRDRERPDLSIRGRKDRSESPRRFGEGLGFEDSSKSARPAPELPDPFAEPFARPEPEPELFRSQAPEKRAERTEESIEIPSWSKSEPPPAREEPIGWGSERGRAREPLATPADEPWERPTPREEPFDPDLPPSRTHRGRGGRPADEPEAEGFGRHRGTPPTAKQPEPWDQEEAVEPQGEPFAAAPREPRRGRGRGRSRGSVPTSGESAKGNEFEHLADVEPDFPEDLRIDEDRSEELPRPRAGRAAIRSRGGDRPAERPRPAPRAMPARGETDLESPRTPAPAAERTRDRDSGRGRAAEAPEIPGKDRDRERPRPHARAGEPGYIPRRDRERLRAGETSFDTLPPYGTGDLSWSEQGRELLDAEAELDRVLGEEPAGDEAEETSAAKLEGRRRRRRRGRRRDRERPAEAGAAPAAEDFEEGLEEREIQEPKVRARRPDYRSSLAEDVGELAEIDFHEAEIGDELIDEEDELEFSQRRAEVPEEAIDPELEREIRREIEEIEVLEREMGLRGPSEARPRRGEEAPARGGRVAGGRSRGLAKPPVQEIFRRGDEVLVQVIKESIGTKGPTLSTYISIPGRYLVLMPGLNRVGVSRKIVDEGQRRKLREIMLELNPPKNLGFIVRTAGLERTKRELAKDLAYLLRLWKVILRRIKKAKAPAPIYQESDMIIRTIRDIFTSDIDTIWIDEPAAFERAQEFLRVVMPRFVNRIKLHEEKVPLFHKYGIEDEIAKIQRRHVPLPEGGSIVIDQTEALVAIDVNSGNFRVEDDAERTAYEMNLRAAKEIGRQLRLRDLGGVIVNDFIDMREERHRRGVERAIRDAVRRDRARTKILRMSAFGLIEMTRQRIRPSLKRSVYEDCSYCTGAGVVKTVESMAIDVTRLLGLASNREDIRRVQITVNPSVATYLNNRKRKEIARIESECQMSIHIGVKENAPAEYLQVECFDANNNEVRLTPLAVTHHHKRGSH